MSMIQEIFDFSRQLDISREAASAIKVKVERLLDERKSLASAPPHTDEIVAAYRSAIEANAVEFEARFAAYASSPDLSDPSTVIGASAALYFMRDLVGSKVPSLVDRLCPGAARGADAGRRGKRRSEIDAALRGMHKQQGELLEKMGGQLRTLRTLKSQAYSSGDRQARSAIEGEEMDFPPEVARVRKDHDALAELLGLQHV